MAEPAAAMGLWRWQIWWRQGSLRRRGLGGDGRSGGGEEVCGGEEVWVGEEVVATAMESGMLIFTYETLKRGFSNHVLMQDLIRRGDARFMGLVKTAQPYPLVCGPYRVPFLLNLPGCGQRVLGELYSVSPAGLVRLDDLEGTTKGHYERLPIHIHIDHEDEDEDEDEDEEEPVVLKCSGMSTEAYFAHRSYAMGLWEKNGNKGLSAYSERETVGYVRRRDRPQHLSFLDHISLFLSSPPPPPLPSHS